MAGTTTPSVHLVDEFENAFQNLLSTLSSQEYFNTGDTEETRTTVEQTTQKFLELSTKLETFFLQKKLVLATHRPEESLKEDIAELKEELSHKEQLLQRHYERLAQWHFRGGQVGGTTVSQVAAAPPVGTPTQQQQPPQQVQQQAPPPPQPQQQPPPQPPQQPKVQQQSHQIHTTIPHPQINLPAPSHQIQQQQQHSANLPQGPLAYLEQTTSNIGMPERR